MLKKLGSLELAQEYVGRNVIGKKKESYIDKGEETLFFGVVGTYLIILFAMLFGGEWTLGGGVCMVGGLLVLSFFVPTKRFREVDEYGDEEVPRVIVNWIDGKSKYESDILQTKYNRIMNSSEASHISRMDNTSYWYYQGRIWKENEDYSQEEVTVLIEHQNVKKARKLEVAKRATINQDESEDNRSRRISQEVMDKVWNRDDGKCRKCGSNEEIEFDHIIPFSKGGSNTYRNIQLLCENCNRSKGNREIG